MENPCCSCKLRRCSAALQELSLLDRFGEPLPEGKRCQFFHWEREGRVAEFRQAKQQVTQLRTANVHCKCTLQMYTENPKWWP